MDTEQDLDLKIYLENYQNSTTIKIPLNCVGTTFRLKLEDNLRRKLNLIVNVSPNFEAKLKVSILESFTRFKFIKNYKQLHN